MKCGSIELIPPEEDEFLLLRCAPFLLRSIPALILDGEECAPLRVRTLENDDRQLVIACDFPGEVQLTLTFHPADDGGIALQSRIASNSDTPRILDRVALLQTPSTDSFLAPQSDPARITVMEQGNYWGKVRPLSVVEEDGRSSDLVWVACDRDTRSALLAGFTTAERWRGQISTASDPRGNPTRWTIGFDGGGLPLAPGSETDLEDLLLLAGPDPWSLLETYADAVARRHRPDFPEKPPVSWCSWYPYRLSVSEERLLAQARIAAERLKPLGLRILEVDLGWEKDELPSTFDENERFPSGLGWLAGQLAELGFDLGVWKAPFTISEYDPICGEHPEYLVQDESGAPAPYWEWFWEPHGKVFILDLTHPGAQQWLADKIASLRERGVRYLKADFIGCVSGPLARKRHDSAVVAGGGYEAARIAAGIIRRQLPDALLLNCGGPELPGTGHWPLIYTCNDTGSTASLSPEFMRDNYQSLACHLFKNRRWGILQPSCLCVGPPGGLDEARLRATAAFMAGGQIDISDTLTSLPEDRWAVLTATLPPLGISARPVDLFEPVGDHPPGSVWHLRVETDWDEWDLIAFFSFATSGTDAVPPLNRYAVPFAQLGLEPGTPYRGFDFWSAQCLGPIPNQRRNAGGYTHPGDLQDLLCGDAPDTLEVAFSGPGVRLLCLRRKRPHPWIAGTTFHQSCGAELARVAWNPETRTLTGTVDRPAGETGLLVLDGAELSPTVAESDGKSIPFRPGASGAWILPITISRPGAEWHVTFAETQGKC